MNNDNRTTALLAAARAVVEHGEYIREDIGTRIDHSQALAKEVENILYSDIEKLAKAVRAFDAAPAQPEPTTLAQRVEAVQRTLWYDYRDPIAQNGAAEMEGLEVFELVDDMLQKALKGEPDERREGWLKALNRPCRLCGGTRSHYATKHCVCTLEELYAFRPGDKLPSTESLLNWLPTIKPDEPARESEKPE
jgi:hypothetical protein